MICVRRADLEKGAVSIPRNEVRDDLPRVHIFLDATAHGKANVLVATLSQDDGEYVFRYDPDYARQPGARPISAFPDLDDEYRAKHLWPFFAARIPPLEREDVREAMAKAKLRPDDTLRLLAMLSGRIITNPYRLELARQPALPRGGK